MILKIYSSLSNCNILNFSYTYEIIFFLTNKKYVLCMLIFDKNIFNNLWMDTLGE